MLPALLTPVGPPPDRRPPVHAESEHVRSVAWHAPLPRRSPTAPVSETSDADVVVARRRPTARTAPELLRPRASTGLRRRRSPRLGVSRRAGRAHRACTRPATARRSSRSSALGERADAASLRLAAGSAVRQLTGVDRVGDRRARRRRRTPQPRSSRAPRSAPTRSTPTVPRRAEAPRARAIVLHAGRSSRRRASRACAAIADGRRPDEGPREHPAARARPAERSPSSPSRRPRPTAGVAVAVLDEDALAADGFGGILGVGQGSSRARRGWSGSTTRPRGAPAHLALVGKGITFDSGGLSLKPGRVHGRR